MLARFTDFDIDQFEKRYRTNLINSISGFKSLQLVGTISEDEEPNLAIFNSIFHLGANPALLGMIVRPDGIEHSTLKNIIAQKFFTLNNVKESYYEQAHQTSARYAAGESEFKKCNLSEYYFNDFKAPFVSEASIKIGLKMVQVIPIEINNTTMVIGEIKLIETDKDFINNDGYVNLNFAGSLTVAGLNMYYSTLPLGVLEYAKP